MDFMFVQILYAENCLDIFLAILESKLYTCHPYCPQYVQSFHRLDTFYLQDTTKNYITT